jgi:hypothetical protein
MMDEQELQWLALLRDEREKREAANTAVSENWAPRERGKSLRAWWGAIEAALDVYERALADRRAPAPPPLEILTALKITVSCLAVGKMPGVAADAISQGRRGPESRERRDIGFAVAYLMAASTAGLEHADEQIIIADNRPVKTVCEAFGVIRTTAQGWRKKIEPAFLGLHPIDGEILESLMRRAGERYKAAGRSASAIAKRCTRN